MKHKGEKHMMEEKVMRKHMAEAKHEMGKKIIARTKKKKR